MQPRILILSAQSSRSGSAYTYRLKSLAGLLEDRGFDVDYFYMEDHFPLDTETTRSIFMPLWLQMLRQYDLIYCGASEAAHALFFCRPFLQSVIMMDMHGDVISQSSQTVYLKTGGRRDTPELRVWVHYEMSLASCHYFITQSRYQMEDLVQQGVGRENVSVVRNGVDPDLFQFVEMPQQPEFPIGYVGAFQTWQGTEYLYEAIGLMKNREARILLVGFSEREKAWKDAFRNSYGDRVVLLDRMDRASLVEKMKSVAVLMSPRPPHIASRAAFPTKFAEYASMGRPVLVTDVDETAEYTRKFNCGFVSRATSRGLAEAMDLAVQTPLETLAQMGRNGRKMVEKNFSWSKIGDDYADLIRYLLARREKQP